MKKDRKLEAALFIFNRDKMDILTVEALAKDLGAHDRLAFDIVGPTGRKEARFKDAYYGVIEIEGKVFNVNDFKYVADVHCENVRNYA